MAKNCKIGKWFLLFLLVIVSFPSVCHHIVGGEIYLKSKGGHVYELGLQMYFNNNNSILSTESSPILLSIYRKSDNKLMASYNVSKVDEHNIAYDNPSCSRSNEVSTRFIKYTADITLSPATYTDLKGYYVVWTTCCRNDDIKNISNPGNTGMVYYTEYPPVVKNGIDFYDSTPIFPEIRGDYACVNQPFVFDFSAKDQEGDSLIYSLTNPIAANSGRPNNTTYNVAGPYYSVTWANGYGLYYILDASKQISVHPRTGLVTFTANQTGLYAFSVKCTEYRHGVQIGYVQRDFQIDVLNCEINNPPMVYLSNDSKPLYNGSTYEISATDDRCFQIAAIDKISGTSAGSSILTVSVNAINFPASSLRQSSYSGTVYSDTDTLKSTFCLDNCLTVTSGQILKAQIVVLDNGCPLGLSDTIDINFLLDDKAKGAPKIFTSLADNIVQIKTGSFIQFSVTATQPNHGFVGMKAHGKNFSLAQLGMDFTEKPDQMDSLTNYFKWKIDCNAFNNRISDTLKVVFVADNFSCTTRYDSVEVDFVVQDTVIDYRGFIPANVFTPNGDQLNDIYALPELPKDNCTTSFQKIVIANRWGNVVYESKSRHFEWNGANVSEGEYFCTIYYNNIQLKGWITVKR